MSLFSSNPKAKSSIGVARRTPASFAPLTIKVGESAATAPAKETALTGRNENNNPERCPVCNRGYIIAKANGHDVRACLDHNIVMPVKD